MARIEVITIGDELVEGRLVDTNSATISESLEAAGLKVAAHHSVADDAQEIVRCLRTVAARCTAALVSGGLGPTTDDLTAACAAEAFDRPLRCFPEALEHVRSFFAERGRPMSPNNAKQADLPEGCQILPNPWGTAVGFSLRIGECRLFFMPGVPRELRGIVDRFVLPEIRALEPTSPPLVATLKIFGMGESDVGQALQGLDEAVPGRTHLSIQYRATFPENHVRLVLRGPVEQHAEEILNSVVDDACQRLGDVVYAAGIGRLDTTFAEAVAAELKARAATVAVCEWFTAGHASLMLHSVPDSAAVFLGGLVAPSRAALARLLNLENRSQSAGSELAEALAMGVRDHFGAEYGVAVAGPGDHDHARPGGTLWVATASEVGPSCRSYSFRFEVARLRVLGAYIALAHLKRAASTT